MGAYINTKWPSLGQNHSRCADGLLLDLHAGLRFICGKTVVMADRAPVAGQWTHIACTADFASGEIRIYLDGEPAGGKKPDAGVTSHESIALIAAWATVANTLINHDECITNVRNKMNLQCTGFDPLWGMSRRQFLHGFGMGMGAFGLSDLLGSEASAADHVPQSGGSLAGMHHAAKAKRVIFLFQSGGPSQIDLLDYKPYLNEVHGQQLPDSVRKGQRLTGMSGNQSSLPLVGSPFKFAQHGQSGQWLSELLPNTSGLADDICIVKSMYTEAINHGPG